MEIDGRRGGVRDSGPDILASNLSVASDIFVMITPMKILEGWEGVSAMRGAKRVPVDRGGGG